MSFACQSLLLGAMFVGPPDEELPTNEPESGIEFATEPSTEAPAELEPAPEPAGQTEYQEFIEQPATPDGGRSRKQRRKRQDPVYGPLLVFGGIGAGPRAFSLGAGVTRFVIPHIGFGLDITDIVVFDPLGTFNEFELATHVWLLPMPRFRATPYLRPGFGGQFFSDKLGVYGMWSGAVGVIVRLGKLRRFHLRLGAEVRGSFPDDRFAENFTCVLTDELCSLGLAPEIGLGFNFGQPE